MKKTLLFFLLISFTAMAMGQASIYHPFPESDAYWTVQASGCCFSNCPPPPSSNPVLDDYGITYSMQGDTMINDISYQKIYKSGLVHSHCAYGNYVDEWWTLEYEYVGAMRQDTGLRQVYFVHPYEQECLLYDFNLLPGDTADFECQDCPVVVASIDSVLVGETYRKRYNLQGGYEFIEGIGSTSGLLEPLCPFEYFGFLQCFVHEGQPLYPDTVTVCDFITNVKDAESYPSLSIYPNPFSGHAVLKADKELLNATLKLYDIFGREVKQITGISGNAVDISAEDLPGGVYFVRLSEGRREIATAKLILVQTR